MLARQTYAVIAFAVVFIVLVVLLFVFRRQIAGAVPNSTSQQALAAGYGYYDEPVSSDCLTMTLPSRCSDTGIITQVQRCVSNPSTGRGCLDNKGNQTFATIITRKSCLPLCRSSGWVNQVTGQCRIPVEMPRLGRRVKRQRGTPLKLASNSSIEPVCYPRDVVGVQTVSKTCAPIDATGPNTCTYEYPYTITPETPPIPPECKLGPNNQVTCSVGYTYTVEEPCIPNLDEDKVCGVWRLQEGETCTYSGSPIKTNDCRNPKGGKYTSDTDILDVGWTTLPMTCVRDTDYSQPAKACLPITDCVQPNDAFTTLLGARPPVICGAQPTCARFCFYLPEDTKNAWNPGIKRLIGTFQQMVSGDYGLGLNNVPCPAPDGKYLAPDIIPTTAPLSDCFGDPKWPLETTNCMWFNINQPTRYGVPISCTGGDVLQYSGLYMTFKPTRPMTSPQVLYCNILVVLGKNYVGWLDKGSSTIVWRQAALEGLFTSQLLTEFMVTLSGDTYTIRFADGTPITVDIAAPPSLVNSPALTLENVSFTLPITDINILHVILNRRQTRWDPTSCNIMYSYPPPPGYPSPDVTSLPLAGPTP